MGRGSPAIDGGVCPNRGIYIWRNRLGASRHGIPNRNYSGGNAIESGF